jgi:hypothetical protein
METKAVYDDIWGFIQIYVWISNLPNILGDEDLYRQTEKEVLVWTIEKQRWLGCTPKMIFSEQGIRRVRFLHFSLHILCFDIRIDWQEEKKWQEETLCILPLGRAKLKKKSKKKKEKKKN